MQPHVVRSSPRDARRSGYSDCGCTQLAPIVYIISNYCLDDALYKRKAALAFCVAFCEELLGSWANVPPVCQHCFLPMTRWPAGCRVLPLSNKAMTPACVAKSGPRMQNLQVNQ